MAGVRERRQYSEMRGVGQLWGVAARCRLKQLVDVVGRYLAACRFSREVSCSAESELPGMAPELNIRAIVITESAPRPPFFFFPPRPSSGKKAHTPHACTQNPIHIIHVQIPYKPFHIYSISQQFRASFTRCARRCGWARTGGGLGLGRGGEACEQQLRAVVQGLVSAPVSESNTSRSETTNSTM